MPTRAEPHHVTHRSRTAVVLIDLLQRFPGSEGRDVHRAAQAMLPALRRFRRAATARRLPIIYVNDDAGPWRSSREDVVRRATRGARGDVARALRPTRRDYMVLKPGRSGFHQAPLEALLEEIGARRLIVAGVATDVCVLATVADAIVRKLRVAVPRDLTCAVDGARRDAALDLMASTMAVDTRPFAVLAELRRPRPHHR